MKEKLNQELATPAQKETATGAAKHSLKMKSKAGIKNGCKYRRERCSKKLGSTN